MVQANDFDVPERGVDLSFVRTYNSQSRHDTAGADGSTPSVFGNGWTNTYDAHLAYNNTYNIISVYDPDGARYDYTANDGTWAPPVGQHAQLEYDGSCGYYWILTNGVTYHFEAPTQPQSNCSTIPGGYLGRLLSIAGRNDNNNIALTYSWNPDASNPENLTEIVVEHSDGRSLTLTFEEYGSNKELASITRPDSNDVTYTYDSSGDLTGVSRPGNNAAATLTENYDYTSGSYAYLLRDVVSPRYVLASGADGADVVFCFDSTQDCQNSPSGRDVTAIIDDAQVNFTPADGTNTALQSGYSTGVQQYRITTFSGYGNGQNSNVVTISDSDGHSRMWTTDSLWRPTELQLYVATNPTHWLVIYSAWDTYNNLIATADARDFETDYSYDSNGNLTEIQRPSISTNDGNLRPTTVYVYDASTNDLLAFCDPVFMATHSSCAQGDSGATSLTWNTTDPAEPYGYLTAEETALGYNVTVSYNTSSEGGDYGLPTDLVGTQIQQANGNNAQPQLHLTYGGNGNIVTASLGYGEYSYTYDTMGDLTAETDPDGVETRACYNLDGTTSALQSARQYALDNDSVCGTNSDLYSYDADADQVRWISHYNSESGTTQWFYDGADRMVEVVQPSDLTIDGGQSGLTRYLYDLTQNYGNLQVGDSNPFAAHGNLYKTQRCNWPSGYTNPCVWTDISGNGFDSLDRASIRLQYAPFGSVGEWITYYDGSYNGEQYLGLPTSSSDMMGVTTYGSYDDDENLSGMTFSNGFDAYTYQYDPNGRLTAATSQLYGTNMYAYDAQGDETAFQQSPEDGTDPEALTYTYYPNGWRESLSVASNSALPSGEEFQYSYRFDGARTGLLLSGYSQPFSWTYTSAGRELTQSDPYTGDSLSANSYVTARELQATTYTYDSYGELSSLTFPSGTYYNTMTYDTEGEITGFEIGMPGVTPPPHTYYATSSTLAYNIRGELTSQSFRSSDGSDEPLSQDYDYDAPTGLGTIDPLTGAIEPTGTSCSSPFFNADALYASCSPSNYSASITYDPLDRLSTLPGWEYYYYDASGSMADMYDKNTTSSTMYSWSCPGSVEGC